MGHVQASEAALAAAQEAAQAAAEALEAHHRAVEEEAARRAAAREAEAQEMGLSVEDLGDEPPHAHDEQEQPQVGR